MTLEDILRMAREADQGHAGMECEQFGGGIVSVSTLERFAELVAAAEREACAKVCADAIASIWEYHDAAIRTAARNVCENLSAAILARGHP